MHSTSAPPLATARRPRPARLALATATTAATVWAGITVLAVPAAEAAEAAAVAATFAIGGHDRLNTEFALAPGGFAQYSQTFPTDVSYTVGTSAPSAWSYIQPGPSDAWAGSKNHAFKVTFSLTATQATVNQLLQLSFIDTHNVAPPTLQVSANGQTVGSVVPPAGSGVGAVGAATPQDWHMTMTKPSSVGIIVPASNLVSGSNTLTITSTAGSWAAYDSVEMVPAPATLGTVQALSIDPSPLFKTSQGHLNQLVDLGMNNTGGAAAAVTIAATMNGVTTTTSLASVPAGRSTQRVPVPPAPAGGPAQLDVKVTVGSASTTYAMNLPYQRRWQIDIITATHLDIGYHYDQANTRQVENAYLDQAVTDCQATANYTDASKYRYTVENSWLLQQYLQDRTADQIAALAKCVRDGQIEMTAAYNNNLQDLASSEQLIRSLSKGTDAMPAYFGVKPEGAIQDDVTGASQQYIQMLAQQGVKVLINSSNSAHTGRYGPRPFQDTSALFNWQAPDGSKVLTFFGPNAYPEGWLYTDLQCAMAPWPTESCGNHNTVPLPFTPAPAPANPASLVPTLASAFGKFLPGIEVGAYPQSVYPMTFTNDTAPPARGMSDLIKAFQQEYDFPRLAFSTPSRFYADATTAQGATSISGFTPDPTSAAVSSLPTKTGDWTNWWTDGAGSSALETGANMQAQARTTAAETLGTLATLNKPDPTRQCLIDAAYQEENLYTEHTWAGPSLQANDPQWSGKKVHADKADRFSTLAMDSATASLGAQLTNSTSTAQLAVFNPQSWSRTAVVTATVPSGWSGRLLDIANANAVVPYQSLGGSKIQFVATNVPAAGYRKYSLSTGTNPTTSSDTQLSWNATTGVLKNQYYTVTISKTTGAVTSLVNNATSAELVDTSSSYDLNQYIFRPGTRNGATQAGHPFNGVGEWSPASPTLTGSAGTVGATVTVTFPNTPNGVDSANKATGVTSQSATITLYANTPRVDIANSIGKHWVTSGEEGYFAFPFKVNSPTVTYDVNSAPVQLGAGQMPGADMDNQAIGSYADISSSTGGVTVSTTDAPLAEFGSLHNNGLVGRPGRLDTATTPAATGLPTNGSMFSYIFNNLWITNYRIAQSGPINYHYSITDHSGGFDAEAATQFGHGTQSPLQAVVVPANQTGTYTAASQSLASLDASNVVIQTVKPATQVNAAAHTFPLVFRLAEVAGTTGNVSLQLPFKVSSAQSLDLTDRPTSTPGALTVADWGTGSKITVPVTKYGIRSVGVKPTTAYYGGSPTICETEADKVPNQASGYLGYNYNQYSTEFPNDVNFTAQTGSSTTPGASHPLSSSVHVNATGAGVTPPQWSYIQPGPNDAWAGSKKHTFTVNFNLCQGVPTNDPTLSLWLLDTQHTGAPSISIALNGNSVSTVQLANGGGDGYHWGDGAANVFNGIKPSTTTVALPANKLRPGSNSVTITTETGSWLVYDGFALGNTSKAVTTTSANAPTDMTGCGIATQSSTYVPALSAAKAIDANTDGAYSHNSISHTNNDVNAWWQVDLRQPVSINTINLWNRTDCCQNRLTDFWVFTSNTPFNTALTPAQQATQPGVKSYRHTGSVATSTAVTQVAGNARYVMVQLNGTGYLTLAEVQVA